MVLEGPIVLMSRTFENNVLNLENFLIFPLLIGCRKKFRIQGFLNWSFNVVISNYELMSLIFVTFFHNKAALHFGNPSTRILLLRIRSPLRYRFFSFMVRFSWSWHKLMNNRLLPRWSRHWPPWSPEATSRSSSPGATSTGTSPTRVCSTTPFLVWFYTIIQVLKSCRSFRIVLVRNRIHIH